MIGLAFALVPSLAQAEPCPAGHTRTDPVSGVRVCTAESKDSKSSGDVAYLFDDDALAGDGVGINAAKIVVRSPGVRRTLIRPRLNFIPELLKSVEML
jgi:hypothetical protein